MFSQLMFLREVQPGTAGHGVAAALQCPDEPDIPALGTAASSVAARRAEAGEAWLGEHDAIGLDDEQLTAWLEYAAHEPFDLDHGPLLRVHLYRTTGPATTTEPTTTTGPQTVALVVTHHEISDFWSMTTLVEDLETSYSELTGDTYEPLPELTDFVRHYCWVSGSRASAHAALNPDSDFLRRLR